MKNDQVIPIEVRKALSLFSFFVLLLFSCTQEIETKGEDKDSTEVLMVKVDGELEEITPDTCSLRDQLLKAGIVKVTDSLPEVFVDLKYSDTSNFLGQDVYGCLTDLFVHPEALRKLIIAFNKLKEERADLTFLIYDGVRPLHVQEYMWNSVDIPLSERGKFLSNPKNTSLHNYGMALDITLCDTSGNPLDMVTDYDDISTASYPMYEDSLFKKGIISKEQKANRILLRKVMRAGGFFGIQTEWWHFNACTREWAKENLTVVP